MSVRKSCKTCKHNKQGVCHFGNIAGGHPCGDIMEYWELADGFNADVLHDDETEHDAVNSPAHYTSGGIECIDCIKAALGENFIGFLIGNVIKYCYRYRNKNGVEDLRKSAKYLEWAIKELEHNDAE